MKSQRANSRNIATTATAKLSAIAIIMVLLASCSAGSIWTNGNSPELAEVPAVSEETPTPTGQDVSTDPQPISTPAPTVIVDSGWFELDEIPVPEFPIPLADMVEGDDNGAFAFIEYVYDVFVYTNATHDLEEWERFSYPDCGFCLGYKATIENSTTKYTDRVYSVEFGESVRRTDGHPIWLFEVFYTEAAVKIWDLPTQTVVSIDPPPTTHAEYLFVTYADDQWFLLEGTDDRDLAFGARDNVDIP